MINFEDNEQGKLLRAIYTLYKFSLDENVKKEYNIHPPFIPDNFFHVKEEKSFVKKFNELNKDINIKEIYSFSVLKRLEDMKIFERYTYSGQNNNYTLSSEGIELCEKLEKGIKQNIGYTNGLKNFIFYINGDNNLVINNSDISDTKINN